MCHVSVSCVMCYVLCVCVMCYVSVLCDTCLRISRRGRVNRRCFKSRLRPEGIGWGNVQGRYVERTILRGGVERGTRGVDDDGLERERERGRMILGSAARGVVEVGAGKVRE